MAIDKNSRYAKTSTYVGTDTNGEQREGFELRSTPPKIGNFFYAPGEGERLDHLAFRFYRDPKKFWIIADCSDELDPFDIVAPGFPICIPPPK